MWNLFSKNQNKRCSTVPVENSHATIAKLRDNLSIQEKREVHLASKIRALQVEAKTKMAQGDKRGALFAMKKKKLQDQELAKIEQIKMTLETQVMNLEGAAHNAMTFTAMKTGTTTMKHMRKGMGGMDKVDDLLDDMRDEMDLHGEVNSAFSRPIDPLMDDDDDLLAELDALTNADQANKLSYWPASPASKPTATANSGTTTTASPPKKFALFG